MFNLQLKRIGITILFTWLAILELRTWRRRSWARGTWSRRNWTERSSTICVDKPPWHVSAHFPPESWRMIQNDAFQSSRQICERCYYRWTLRLQTAPIYYRNHFLSPKFWVPQAPKIQFEFEMKFPSQTHSNLYIRTQLYLWRFGNQSYIYIIFATNYSKSPTLWNGSYPPRLLNVSWRQRFPWWCKMIWITESVFQEIDRLTRQ